MPKSRRVTLTLEMWDFEWRELGSAGPSLDDEE